MKVRVQKLIAEAGIASRRGAEELIEQERVRINGEIAKLGDKAEIETDEITVDGERLRVDQLPKRYIALYKPQNVLSTSEPHESDRRDTIMELVPDSEGLFSIGRLDVDSEGLIVLTNDGALANRLSHPRYRHTKTYHVTVLGLPTASTISRWESGIYLDEDGRTAPCSVQVIKGGREVSVLKVVMTEGKKRQIRRVASALGHPVRRLIRTQIGMLTIEGLKPGEYRDLTKDEIKLLETPSFEIKLLSRRNRAQKRLPGGQQIERPSRRAVRSSSARSGKYPRSASSREGADTRPRRLKDSSEPPTGYAPRAKKSDGSETDRPRRPYNREGGEGRSRHRSASPGGHKRVQHPDRQYRHTESKTNRSDGKFKDSTSPRNTTKGESE